MAAAKSSARKPIDRARDWWSKRHDRDEYVGSSESLPPAPVARVLREERLILEFAGRRVWILTEPNRTDSRAILLQNYWPVVAKVMDRYAPSALVGMDAIRLHLGNFAPPTDVRVYHSASKSRLDVTLEAEFRLHLRPGRISKGRLQHIAVGESSSVAVLAPADLLGTLDEEELETDIEAACSWLRHLVIKGPDLDAALNEAPRPLVIQRLADLAGQVGNTSLAKQLDSASRRHSATVAHPARTGVGSRIKVPAVMRNAPRGSGTAWEDEQIMRLDRQRSDVRRIIGSRSKRLKGLMMTRVVSGAQKSKAYDAYHNTTMEGYRITREAADAIVRGEPLSKGPHSAQEMQAAMAVQGYSIAFDSVIDIVRKRPAPQSVVTSALILDLYEDLFRPSVDAGIVETGALRGWRNGNVSLKGWRHVPPNHRKIRDLIGGLETFSADPTLDTVTRSLLVHLEFVTIHPFFDGNGRLGRLLMNLCLMSGGLPWVTVRNDERLPFFQAIESAQVEHNATPYIEFVWHLIRSAATDAASRKSG
ncbi:MAG TPA: Fic family protein [Gemmatimonadaceae bacterium]|nr:Fic family protein [Gemmatimonadaceae bacterium]